MCIYLTFDVPDNICLYCNHSVILRIIFSLSSADSRFAPSQWEMSLQNNAVSHWLGTILESALLSYGIMSLSNVGVNDRRPLVSITCQRPCLLLQVSELLTAQPLSSISHTMATGCCIVAYREETIMGSVQGEMGAEWEESRIAEMRIFIVQIPDSV